MTQLILSLFPGIGLLDIAFEEQGFCVVRGPDLLWGGDIKRFHPPANAFDGVISGPPCQAHSNLRHLVRAVHGDAAVKEDLIPEFSRCIAESQPVWFLMENVPNAPTPETTYATKSILLDNRWLGETQSRKRRFTFGTRDILARERFKINGFSTFDNLDYEHAVCATAGGRRVPVAIGGSGKKKRSKLPHDTTRPINVMCELQGLRGDFFGVESPFTLDGKRRMIGNGVPLPMGRAVAKAVVQAITRAA